ncbi:hypothetical protein GZ77_18900 [Endozoicomonas montiporae]|uniref:Uncharacterized protein n=2 Tax=Endozoicomonas montiporae TaxID=1027273 RepID=A0A081N2A4_9GAMM|nr:hypothetical protein [Endozoicomonas montiporae]AMO58462.1 hypothetical protein EZMO1_4550 [Endozoicomonas montiporae CL-33]KEQ12577.1 hypothetical protein GZ77_18900 [Endozoicomonas montiporae]
MKYLQVVLLSVISIVVRLQPVIVYLLICFMAVFCPEIYSDDEVFCFTDLGGGTCKGNEKNKTDFLGEFELGKGSIPIFIDFMFRAYDDDKSEKWQIRREPLSYGSYGLSEVSESSYTIEMTSPERRSEWIPGEGGKVKGGDDDGKPDKYYHANLILTFHDSYLDKLDPGEHTFWLWVKGRVAGEDFNNFYIEIRVIINTQVKISGLENVSFGTFLKDSFSRVHSQPFCVYVQGGGNFKLTPTTYEGAFTLEGAHTNDSIDYSVYLANTGMSYREVNYGSILTGFRGDRTENCTTAVGENMQLKLELPDINTLSTRKADIYVGTLTLTVEPE